MKFDFIITYLECVMRNELQRHKIISYSSQAAGKVTMIELNGKMI